MRIPLWLERAFDGIPGRLRSEIALTANLASRGAPLADIAAAKRYSVIYDRDLGTIWAYIDNEDHIISSAGIKGAA